MYAFSAAHILRLLPPRRWMYNDYDWHYATLITQQLILIHYIDSAAISTLRHYAAIAISHFRADGQKYAIDCGHTTPLLHRYWPRWYALMPLPLLNFAAFCIIALRRLERPRARRHWLAAALRFSYAAEITSRHYAEWPTGLPQQITAISRRVSPPLTCQIHDISLVSSE